jgi:molecular chaperone DnaJ
MITRGDYYETLGVPRSADTETIKSAFRRLAHHYHPDVSTEPDAEQRFREIAEAYSVLSDPAQRASYDDQGSAGLEGASAEDLWGGINFTDVFGSRAASFGNLFERLFGPAAAGPQPGDDVRQDLTIPLEEVMTGADHIVTIRRPSWCRQCAGRGSRSGTAPRRCEKCGGTGERTMASRHGPLLVGKVTICPECAGQGRVIDDPCPTCRATGRATQTETVTIRIPPGIPEGASLRLAGQGMPSPMNGGPAGDLYVSVNVRADPRFRRVGADLWHDLHIQASDAALGVTIMVPLPDGEVKVRVPPGTQPGSVLRVTGKGLPRYDEDGRGNLLLTMIIDIPRQLKAPQRHLYEQLRAADTRSAVDDSQTTASDHTEPEVARPGRMASTSGTRNATDRMFPFASVLLILAGITSIVCGMATISALSLVLQDTRQGLEPSTWGWMMITIGVAELLGAIAIQTRRRVSRQVPNRTERVDAAADDAPDSGRR